MNQNIDTFHHETLLYLGCAAFSKHQPFPLPHLHVSMVAVFIKYFLACDSCLYPWLVSFCCLLASLSLELSFSATAHKELLFFGPLAQQNHEQWPTCCLQWWRA